jgi:hypothetical protein
MARVADSPESTASSQCIVLKIFRRGMKVSAAMFSVIQSSFLALRTCGVCEFGMTSVTGLQMSCLRGVYEGVCTRQ